MTPPLRAFLATFIVALAIGLAAIVWWDATRPVTVVVHDNADATIVVDLVGAVASPGPVDLPAGGRLEQAISEAGGLAPDADITRIYLAKRLDDGEQVVIPSLKPTFESGGPTPPTAGGGSTAAADTGNLININTASVQDLTLLPGIGDVLAQRIVDYRDQHGPFTSIDQLDDVDGIGPALLKEISPLVTLGD
jgi:competence protein ComEA